MLHNVDLIYTLTGGLLAALVFGFITERLKLSPIVGYLLAGVAVGPFTPGYVASPEIAEQFAEVGVILLMFGVGIHFHVQELLAVRKVAIPGALIQIAVATGLGLLITHFLGWSIESGIVYGLAISVASTVVLLRVLADYDELHTSAGHVAVGWLLVEDLFTVIVLVMLPLLSGPRSEGAADSSLFISIGIALLKIAGLVVFTFLVGTRLIPMILGYVAKTGSRELFTLSVLVIALGIAVGSAALFGASMALGAFLAGMVVGQSVFSARAASEALPLRDAFAVLFFVSMGMLFNPSELLDNIWLTLATLAVVLLGKPIAAAAVVLVLKHPLRTALAVSVALAQVGEFSFMLAALATSLKVLPPEATQSLVVASIISITLNPLIFRFVDPLAKKYTKPTTPETNDPGKATIENHIIVIGYGPVGKQVVTLLRQFNLEPTVIDLNLDTVKQLRTDGIRAIYGDASQREILETAGVRSAAGLVFASNGRSLETVKNALELNSKLMVLSRATYLREAPALQAVGAVAVVSEAEVALAITERLLRRLGATAEQVDRARDDVREEIDRATAQAAPVAH